MMKTKISIFRFRGDSRLVVPVVSLFIIPPNYGG